MSELQITRDDWLQNEKEYIELLSNNTHWNSVPLLNVNDVQHFPNGKLVRFHGMVQDMFNPEYYYEKCEVVNEVSSDRRVLNGKFSDMLGCKSQELIDHNSINNVTGERKTFVVISVPCLNDWVTQIEMANHKILITSADNTTTQQIKRTLEPDFPMETESINGNITNSSKRQCASQDNSSTFNNALISKEHLLNFPILNDKGKACHVKVYEDADNIKLNDLIELVGFLSVDSIPAYDDCNDSDMEEQIHNPPPSLIPRIHCIMWKQKLHNNLLNDNTILDENKMSSIKKELELIFTQLFLGDTLAAEYFIYHLISRVYSRIDLLPLGKFSLNISRIPVGDIQYVETLYEFIKLLVLKSHYFPMSLDNMNATVFVPKKDYESDRVISGLLQLSNNTHLVLDETKLSTGRLNEAGVKAVSEISNAIRMQKVRYDFNYYTMDFDCDIPFLILSEGKSLLPSDVHLVLKPDESCVNIFPETVEALKHFLKPELLNDIRVYLTQVRHAKYDLPDSLRALIQNEFVQMRQTKTITADDLHQLLVVARLICLSEGKSTLDENSWKMACMLEEERKKRIL